MTLPKRGDKMSNDERIAVLENTNAHILTTLDEIKNALIRIDIKLDSKFDTLDRKIDSNFKWLLTIMIGGFVGTWGVLSHVLHWV